MPLPYPPQIATAERGARRSTDWQVFCGTLMVGAQGSSVPFLGSRTIGRLASLLRGFTRSRGETGHPPQRHGCTPASSRASTSDWCAPHAQTGLRVIDGPNPKLGCRQLQTQQRRASSSRITAILAWSISATQPSTRHGRCPRKCPAAELVDSDSSARHGCTRAASLLITTKSVRRLPHFVQRNLRSLIGLSPCPASMSACRSAAPPWRQPALHRTHRHR
jgi:hypothetical protein